MRFTIDEYKNYCQSLNTIEAVANYLQVAESQPEKAEGLLRKSNGEALTAKIPGDYTASSNPMAYFFGNKMRDVRNMIDEINLIHTEKEIYIEMDSKDSNGKSKIAVKTLAISRTRIEAIKDTWNMHFLSQLNLIDEKFL